MIKRNLDQEKKKDFLEIQEKKLNFHVVCYRNETNILRMTLLDIICLPNVLVQIIADYEFVPDFGLLDCLNQKLVPIGDIQIKSSNFEMQIDALRENIIAECCSHVPRCQLRLHILERFVAASLQLSFLNNITLDHVFDTIFFGYQCIAISQKLYRYLCAVFLQIRRKVHPTDRIVLPFLSGLGYLVETLRVETGDFVLFISSLIVNRCPLEGEDLFC